MNKYMQKYPETCLAKCLQILEYNLGKNVTANELDIFIFGLKYSRENFDLGQIIKVARDCKEKYDWIVDTKMYYDYVKKLKLGKNIKLTQAKINLKTIDSLLYKPLITYLDAYYLWERKCGVYYKYHWPHFVVVLRKVGNNYEIIDPTYGKTRLIDKKILTKSISSLKNRLWLSPKIIRVQD